MTHHAPHFNPAAARVAPPASLTSAGATVPGASPLIAPLSFMVPQEEKPVYLSAALQGGKAKPLFETEEHAVSIHDMRPLADAGALSLDHEGFELIGHGTRADLWDDEDVRQIYTPEIETFLKTTWARGG